MVINMPSLADQSRYTLHPELSCADVQFKIDNCPGPLIIIIDKIKIVPALPDEVYYFLESPLAASKVGAATVAIFNSLVCTCKINGINIQEYLTDILGSLTQIFHEACYSERQ